MPVLLWFYFHIYQAIHYLAHISITNIPCSCLLWSRWAVAQVFSIILISFSYLLICIYCLMFSLLLWYVLGCFDLRELWHRFSTIMCSYFHIYVDPHNISSPFNTIRPYDDSYWSTSILGSNSCMLWLKIIHPHWFAQPVWVYVYPSW